MFGKGGGWAITMLNFRLMVALGGVVEKPRVVDGEIKIREYLDINHDIVHGAPVGRFVKELREVVEGGYGL